MVAARNGCTSDSETTVGARATIQKSFESLSSLKKLIIQGWIEIYNLRIIQEISISSSSTRSSRESFPEVKASESSLLREKYLLRAAASAREILSSSSKSKVQIKLSESKALKILLLILGKSNLQQVVSAEQKVPSAEQKVATLLSSNPEI